MLSQAQIKCAIKISCYSSPSPTPPLQFGQEPILSREHLCLCLGLNIFPQGIWAQATLWRPSYPGWAFTSCPRFCSDSGSSMKGGCSLLFKVVFLPPYLFYKTLQTSELLCPRSQSQPRIIAQSCLEEKPPDLISISQECEKWAKWVKGLAPWWHRQGLGKQCLPLLLVQVGSGCG